MLSVCYVPAVSFRLYSYLAPACTVVQVKDCRYAAAVLMADYRKLQKKTDDQAVGSPQAPPCGRSCGGRAVAQQRARGRDL
ncbi:hypothetical protein ILYODFUR_001402 [Ilyodon furcidens]|uniref:Uncharacterized protein n=1 Tax=Ilyodon furcidens TaxID=33524 RepID=A0ABV0TF61_9TELE